MTLLDASNSTHNYVVALACNVTAAAIAAFGARRYPGKRNYSLPLVLTVLLPAALWSMAVLAHRKRTPADAALEAESFAGLYYLWILLGAPVVVCLMTKRVLSRRPSRIDACVLVALIASWVIAAWTALFGAASV